MALPVKYDPRRDYSKSRYNEWARHAPKLLGFKSIYAADADMYHYGKKSIKCLIESKIVGEKINLSAQTKLPAIANACGLPAFTIRSTRQADLKQWSFDLVGDNRKACEAIINHFRIKWNNKSVLLVPSLSSIELCKFLDDLPDTDVKGPIEYKRISWHEYLSRDIVE